MNINQEIILTQVVKEDYLETTDKTFEEYIDEIHKCKVIWNKTFGEDNE